MSKVLLLVNPATLQILSTKDYIAAFEQFSEHEVSYLPELPPAWKPLDAQGKVRSEADYGDILSGFDAVVITQHLRLCFDGWINPNLEVALLKYGGVKVVFLHDEYDNTEKTREWLEIQKVNLVFSVVPEEHIEKVYDPARFPNTQFKSILTGYYPLKFHNKHYTKPIADRSHLIVYRGRVSPQSYGDLAKQKEMIGRYFDKYCQDHNCNSDIQWEEAERVYGLDWYGLLETGVATLGTESGSNVFDEFGRIRSYVDGGGKLPGPKELNFVEENLGFKMNQISARLFEAIGCGTGLVLYQGDYSGVLTAGEHYISVNHDHSNIEEVIETLRNTQYVQNMVDDTRRYCESKKEIHFSYMIALFDSEVSKQVKLTKHTKVVNKEAVSITQSLSLSVGEFSDISATGIGVFSALHSDAMSRSVAMHQSVKLKIYRSLGRYPRVQAFAKRVYLKYTKLYYIIYLLCRKIYRFIPNAFPVLGETKRSILSYLRK